MSLPIIVSTHPKTRAFAAAVGMGAAPGAGGAAAARRQTPAYVWYDGQGADGVERQLSFDKAHANAASLAARLRAAAQLVKQDGAGESFTVGIVLRRSAALPLAQLATFKAGATFVPCDPSWPKSRTADILLEAEVVAVVMDEDADPLELGDTWAGATIHVANDASHVATACSKIAPTALELEVAAALSKISAVANGTLAWAPPEVMYIMYTSGSTGKPKGCVVPTASVWHRFGWGTKLLGFKESDIFVQKTPATFDCSIPELWVHLYLGCTAVVVPDGGHLDFVTLARVMERGHVTVAHFVPSVLALFLSFVKPGDLPHLRQISCTGEALLHSHRERLTRALGRSLPLFNLYGPTEAAIEVTYYQATDEELLEEGGDGSFPIGYAGDAGVLMYVVAQGDVTKLMPHGETGEICIGGIQVAQGYLKRPELNAKAFVPNPYAEGLLYHTGDLGRVDEVGRIRYQGRADRQVKVGGVRIELGEIESVVLKQLPELLHVAVEKAGDKLVGVASARPGEVTSASVIKSAVAASSLPAPYQPAEWMVREQMPLVSAGKVDHKKVLQWITEQQTAETWGSIYDEMYFADGLQVEGLDMDPTMDWAAYTDSFTNAMHERPTIVEWVDETVREIIAFKPRRVIEMGCGKGMILYRVAAQPYVEEYAGADLARQAIAHVERTWASEYKEQDVGPTGLAKLSTHVLDASNFAGFKREAYDAVVCNGVTMYFPSAGYLVDVLKNGTSRVAPGGTMHLGDVISLQGYPYFVLRAARHAGASFDSLQQPEVRAELMASAKDRCYDHALFYELHARGELEGVAAVEVQLKHGEIMSEFTRYRYNVLLHVGPPVEPLDLIDTTDGAAAATPEAAVASLVNAANAHPDAVVAFHSLANARLTADRLLYTGVSDAVAPAVQVGVNSSGGIDMAQLRRALQAALPEAHVVVTWARSGKIEEMDIYVMPQSEMRRGLRAVAIDATALADAGVAFDVDSYTNVIAESKTSAKQVSDVSEALAAELRSLWKSGEPRKMKQAVLGLLGSKLGVSAAEMADSDRFASHGGNSFVAMQVIGKVRELFGVSVPVFTLMTETFGGFCAAAADARSAAAGSGESSDAPKWIQLRVPQRKHSRLALPQRLAPPTPSYVLFPMAGASPRQFAPVYLALAKLQPYASFYFVQPPGRDARAAEPHATSIEEFVAPIAAELKTHLEQLQNGPCFFVGDSWGSIAALLVAQRLHETVGFCPQHLIVSGNESPEAVSDQKGLGFYSDKSIREMSDDELSKFLVASGAAAHQISPDVIAALRADCLLHEDYVKPPGAAVPPLPCQISVLIGEKDDVTRRSHLMGWMDEATSPSFSVHRVPQASHYIYAEQPTYIASFLTNICSEVPAKHPLMQQAPAVTAAVDDDDGTALRRSQSSDLLGPPCAFVTKRVCAAELQKYRLGNMMYRQGSAFGSRGELANLTELYPDHQPKKGSPNGSQTDLAGLVGLQPRSASGELASLAENYPDRQMNESPL